MDVVYKEKSRHVPFSELKIGDLFSTLYGKGLYIKTAADVATVIVPRKEKAGTAAGWPSSWGVTSLVVPVVGIEITTA